MTTDWISVRKQLPDSDTTVMVHCPKESEPVWLGYWDSEYGTWRTIDHAPVTVTHWQHLPEVPKKGKAK
jgi:hypothetical protein